MQIIISGRHMDVSADLREHIEDLCSRLSKYDRDLMRIEMTLTEERSRFVAEAELSIRKAGHLHAEADAGDVRSAVDRLHDKLKRLLTKARSRRRDHQGPPKDITIIAEPDPEDV